MADDVAKMADAAATMSQASAPSGGKIERPTPTSERTIVLIVVMAFVWVAGAISVMAFGKVPDHVVLWLGIALIVLVTMPLLIALAFASPWLGSERISAGPSGVNIEVNGSKTSQTEGS